MKTTQFSAQYLSYVGKEIFFRFEESIILPPGENLILLLENENALFFYTNMVTITGYKRNWQTKDGPRFIGKD